MKNKLVNIILKTNINTTLKLENLERKSFYYEEKKSRDWCPFCNEENTFIHKNVWKNWDYSDIFYELDDIAYIISNNENWETVLKEREKDIPKTLIKIHKAECTYDNQHIIYYAYSINKKGEIFKFAEWPYDLIRKKMPLIDKKIVKKIGIGKFLEKTYKSFQENLCLGAYFYLRRIVEEIVKYIENIKNLKNENNFQHLGKRVENIKKFLPEYIRKNIKNFTKILNESIHNWNEAKAKENYEIIISFVEFLINDLEKQENQKKDEKIIDKKIKNLANQKNNNQ